jgi:hypothetical protein
LKKKYACFAKSFFAKFQSFYTKKPKAAMLKKEKVIKAFDKKLHEILLEINDFENEVRSEFFNVKFEDS